MKVRIKFSKKGPIKFIGHLDMMRYFQKAIRRSEFPIHYSTGFSPHQIMSFAAPLGVGIESEGEYFDVETDDLVSSKEWVDKLNLEMAPGVKVEGVYILPDDVKNAMASVAAASYRIEWKKEAKTNFETSIAWFLEQNEVMVDKETKKGITQRNISPFVYSMKTSGENGVFMFVDASSSDNLKPKTVLDVLLKHEGIEVENESFQIVREEVYTRINDEFISLGEVGKTI